MKFTLCLIIFCVSFYIPHISEASEQSCQRRNQSNVGGMGDIDEKILIVFLQMRDKMNAVIEKVNKVDAELSEQIESLETKIENLDQNAKAEMADIKTQLDAVKSIPDLIEQMFQKYKLPGQQEDN